MTGFDGIDARGFDGLLRAFVDGTRAILGEALSGVYLHGSMAMGCFHPRGSDIDLIVVVDRAPEDAVKRRYMDLIVALDAQAPPKGLELSVVCRNACRPFAYPTPFLLHYSRMHLDRYRRDPDGYVRDMRGVDRDLAAHFTILRLRGRALYGPEPARVFGEVPRADYMDSLLSDVESAREDVAENPVYVILNLCRVLAFARDGEVLSKREGGRWGMKNLPGECHGLVAGALAAYDSGTGFQPPAGHARVFADAMLKRIEGLRGAGAEN